MAVTNAGLALGLDAQAHKDRRVQLWLYAVAALVVAMITVGGATRLTDSGLSITEWKPILGAIPPLTEAHWLEAFAKYREIPEYHLVNKGMSLEEFKFIYWWEWGHRFLGRIIGLAFALPLAVFWLRGDLRPGFGKKCAGVLVLGAIQGGIGWYMVKSGLVDRVDVSHYRLALHLTVAFLILSLVVWLAVSLDPEEPRPLVPASSERRLATLLVPLILAQVVLGAFVAGLKGGLVHNTWPLMDGGFVPSDWGALSPWWHNIIENPAAAQFHHRLMAYLVVGLVLAHAWVLLSHPRDARLKTSAVLLASAVLAQTALGVWTLLARVPVSLGVAHQGFAAILLILAVRHLHLTRRGLE